jgi:glycosyltransferase involved in cell wall biosynthesis
MQNGAPDLSTTSGPQLHVTAVIRGLQKLGHPVRTVAIQKPGLVWSDDLAKWNAPFFGFTEYKMYRLFQSGVRRLQTELKLPFIGIFDSLRYADACAHLLHGYHLLFERQGYMGYGGLLAARRLGIPLVIEMNGNIVREIDEIGIRMTPLQRKIGRWLTCRTLRGADHIVAVSAALKRDLVADLGLPEEKISVVLNGVDVKLFSKPYNQQQIRAQYRIGAGPAIAFVGSFQPWHGVDLLVSSFKLLQDRFPAVQLILMGDGAGRGTVEKQIADLALHDRVIMTGRLNQEEVAGLLTSADVLVAPYPLVHTNIVGTPLKLLEYMAAGRAIVASTAPLHEVIIDGTTGIRVAPASAEALAEGIARLLDDAELRTRLGAAAQRQAQRYSWDGVAEQLRNIFVTVLAARARHIPVNRSPIVQ